MGTLGQLGYVGGDGPQGSWMTEHHSEEYRGGQECEGRFGGRIHRAQGQEAWGAGHFQSFLSQTQELRDACVTHLQPPPPFRSHLSPQTAGEDLGEELGSAG